MIRELQETAYRKRYIADELEIKVDFVALAESWEVKAIGSKISKMCYLLSKNFLREKFLLL